MQLKSLITVLVALFAFSSVPSLARDGDCPPRYLQRTPEQVLESHRALLATGDVETDVSCNYAEEAVVISDQGVDEGRDAILASLSGLFAAFGGSVPTVTEQLVVHGVHAGIDMVRIRFSISTSCLDIPDGTDTYLIKNGQIHAQTAHGLPIFKCGPPAQAP